MTTTLSTADIIAIEDTLLSTDDDCFSDELNVIREKIRNDEDLTAEEKATWMAEIERNAVEEPIRIDEERYVVENF